MTSVKSFSAEAAHKLSEFFADERGATAIEYAMIAAGIAAAIAATVFSLGTQVKDELYQKISDGIP